MGEDASNVTIAIFDTGPEPAKDNAALGLLGAATILSWHRLPIELRREILDMVNGIDGVPQTENAKARLLKLIEHNTQAVS